jgi:hypothetical protein
MLKKSTLKNAAIYMHEHDIHLKMNNFHNNIQNK